MKSNELPFVRDMFNRIAPHYDFLNRLLSLRRDLFWRRVLVRQLQLTPGAVVLDMACGTADVALEIARQAGNIGVIGADFAPNMLRLARDKIEHNPTRNQTTVALTAADAFRLPFRPNQFNVITMAFGIRNIQDKTGVLQTFYKHLKPGGQLAILELATPERGLLRQLYLTYFNRLLPLLGKLFSKHTYAYTYLPESVAKFPNAVKFSNMMRLAGYKNIRYRKMTMGIAVVFIGEK
jgi:demethylmenaquinone methyltransferase/2-methoxy-6-polyprenyl-1,4-benzoquinol methylase